jgi:TonB-dependent starch-binding outer membrane protein SusC
MLLAIMRKAAMLLLAVIGFTAFTQAQTVKGTVTDSKGEPISGISVTVRGTTKGTSTGTDGTYTLNDVPNGSTLVFSGAGFNTQSLKSAGGSLNVSMVSTVANLNEVVVVGYGVRKVKDATGSVAAITPKDFNKGQISTPEQLFQGRTPGVVVTPSSGEPGAAATINIRGTASIRGNQQPLYVVDGVPLDGGGTSGGASGIEGDQTPKNPLMFINPNDIESISILKDASSAAIYGSRGANGVIIITTKNGRGKKGTFTFGMNTSVATTANRYDVLNSSDFVRGVIRMNIASGTNVADAYTAAQAVDKGYNTNWQDEIFRTALSQNYNLGWGFGRKNTSLRLSASYDDQQGIVKTSSLKRLTGRANFNQRFLNDKIKIDATLTVSNIKNRYVPNTNNAGYQGSLIGAAVKFNPTFPITNPDGSYYDPGDGARNPVQMLNGFDDRDNINRVLANLSGSYEFKPGLIYKVTLGVDNSKGKRTAFADPRLIGQAWGGVNGNPYGGPNYNNPIGGNGRGTLQDLANKSLLVEHTVTYNKVFNKVHDINAVAGYSYQSNETEYAADVYWGLSTPVVNPKDVFVKDINKFTNKNVLSVPFYGKSELQSFFGRVNYTYNDKYLLTATLRADGSSRFGKNNRYGIFPAFAARWKVLNESFAAPLAKTFSDISIRANYGVLGSQDGIGYYDAIPLIRKNPDGTVSQVHNANSDLKWEQATTTGVGIDFTLKNNRISGTIDYYSTKRRDILFFGQAAGGFAAGAAGFLYQNLPGYVLNTGLEFSLNLAAIKKRSFTWDINYNMTFLKNEIREFTIFPNTGAVNGQGLTGAFAQTFANGYPLFTFKMLDFQGYDKNGFAVYGNNFNDILAGSALPTFTAGITNSFSFGRWNASVFVNGSKGFYVYNNTANALLLAGSLKTAQNVTYDVFESGENPINPGSVSTRFLEKGDFIRISNALIGYNFKIKSKFIRSLTATLSGQNLALFTNYSGLDPEVNVDKQLNSIPSRGFDYLGYPKARVFTLGLNLGF